jgi:hypothetical protein
MVNLQINLDSRAVEISLNEIAKNLNDLKTPLNKVGNELLVFFGEKVFATQGGAIDENWRNLAVKTLKARAAGWGHYKNTPIETNKKLVWTGKLKSGFQKTVSDTRLEIDNKVKYFKYNQKTRPMLKINQEVVNIVVKNFTDYLAKITK